MPAWMDDNNKNGRDGEWMHIYFDAQGNTTHTSGNLVHQDPDTYVYNQRFPLDTVSVMTMAPGFVNSWTGSSYQNLLMEVRSSNQTLEHSITDQIKYDLPELNGATNGTTTDTLNGTINGALNNGQFIIIDEDSQDDDQDKEVK